MDKVKLIYVLAASHSGSTLTAMLLGAHPRACTVGELKLNAIGDAEKYLCACQQPILACPFWREVSRGMQSYGEAFEITNPRMDFSYRSSWLGALERPLYRGEPFETLRQLALGLSSKWRSHIESTQKRNVSLVRSVLDVSGADAIVDSSKIGSRLNYLLKNPELDVFVVRVIRDGRAVALTYMDPERYADASNPALRGGGQGLSRDSEILPMQSAAYEWRRSNEEAQSILRSVSQDRQAQVRYEDICADPLGELNRLYKAIGLEELKALPSFRSANPHVIGNGMRLDSTEEIVLDERWRGALTSADLACFEETAGQLNRDLGYA